MPDQSISRNDLPPIACGRKFMRLPAAYGAEDLEVLESTDAGMEQMCLYRWNLRGVGA